MDESITESCGNVFLDLEFPPWEAKILTMRSELMIKLGMFISTMPQKDAAKLLGIQQSRVSDLVRGKWRKFSLDMLVTLAMRAGMKVDLNVAA